MEKKLINTFFKPAIYPILFVGCLWLIKIIEVKFLQNFVTYGLYPRRVEGLTGIITSVFVHSDWKHLFNNSIPLIVLGWSLVHFYKEVALKVVIGVVLMGGLWTWISAREAYHIGASGLLYGMFSFLLFSGFIRRNKQLVAISMLVAFLYGSLVWGILPYDYKISWESHFWGVIAGFSLAIYYRKVGMQKEKHIWDEKEEAILDNLDYWKSNQEDESAVKIIYKKKEEGSD